MKRCPACGSTFTDNSLRFCLQDGTTLQSVSDSPQSLNPAETLRDDSTGQEREPPPTEKFNLGAAQTVQISSAAPTIPARAHPSTRETADNVGSDRARDKRQNPLVIAAVTAVVVLLLVMTGFGVVYLLRDKTPDNTNKATAVNNTRSENISGANANNSTARANFNNSNANANVNKANVEMSHDAPLKITATASSTLAPVRGNTYLPNHVLDGSLLTAWSEGVSGPSVGEWIRCDFNREVKLRRILITPGYFKSTALWSQNNRLAAATFYFSDGTSRRFTFPDRMQEQRLETGNVKTRWVRMVIEETYAGSVDSEDTPISQMTFEVEE
jgi:hypothetical protein